MSRAAGISYNQPVIVEHQCLYSENFSWICFNEPKMPDLIGSPHDREKVNVN
jgi:hypothetical protein